MPDDLDQLMSEIYDKMMYRSILEDHKDLEFVKRILQPELNPEPLMIEGNPATHLMAAEEDGEGNWFAFPTVVNESGVLRHIPDGQAAREEALRRGEIIPFGKDKESALSFSKNYKPDSFSEYFRRPPLK